MKSKKIAENLAAHLPSVLKYHETMLADKVRNRLLSHAIARAVNPESRFLDVGAGTGIWAVLAAKRGAKRVVAIESEECLIPVIRSVAVENGVADRIEIIHGRSADVRIRERFDVIVSELFGGDAFGKTTIEAMIDVRERFLAPGGVLLPQKLSLLAAPVRITPSKLGLSGKYAVSVDHFRNLRKNYSAPVPKTERDAFELLAEPKELVKVDFHSVQTSPSTENLYAEWGLKRIDRANAVIVFNRSTFGPRLELDGMRSQSWGVSNFEFVPFSRRQGRLYFRSTFDRQKGNWTVGVADAPECTPQSFGPVFALSRIQLGLASTPHRKFKPRK